MRRFLLGEESSESATNQMIAFIFITFPKITETFILREILQLQKLGVRIEIFSLLNPSSRNIVHPEAAELVSKTHYSPWLLSLQLWHAHFFYLTRCPIRYLRLFLRLVAGSARQPVLLVKTIAIFPKCVFFARIAQKAGIQHIHATFASHTATCAMVMAELMQIHYSVTAAAYDLFVETPLLKKLLSHAQFVRTISNFNVRLIQERYGEYIASKTYLVRRGIDMHRFRPTPFHSQIDDRNFAILCVATFEHKKGHQFLLKAISILRKQDRNIKCVLIGNGPLRNQITDQIEHLKIQDAVIMVGTKTQEEVLEWLKKSDCFVLPSIIGPGGRKEGIPNVLIEALSCGLPVVATNISGIPEIIKDRESGLLVLPEDVDALVAAISYIQDHPLLAQKLGMAGREIVKRDFNIEENAKKLWNLFMNVLHKCIT